MVTIKFFLLIFLSITSNKKAKPPLKATRLLIKDSAHFPNLSPKNGCCFVLWLPKNFIQIFCIQKPCLTHLMEKTNREWAVSWTREVSQWKLIPDRGPVSKGDVPHLNIIRNLIMSKKYNYLRWLYYIVVLLDGVYRWKERRVRWMISVPISKLWNNFR